MERLVIQRIAVAVVAATMLIVVLTTLAPARLFSVGGRYVRAAQIDETDVATPPQLCSQAEINNFSSPTMMSDLSAAVNPLGVDSESVSLVFVELPPDTCVGFHPHNGAAVIYVRKGAVEYVVGTYASDTEPAVPGVVVQRGPATVEATVGFGTPVVLGADEWVTENDRVWHSYRNAGVNATAEVVIANYAEDPANASMVPTPGAGGCRSGCVSRGP